MNNFSKSFFMGVFFVGLFCSTSAVLAKEYGSEGCDASLKELREVANGTRPPSKLVWREVKSKPVPVKKRPLRRKSFQPSLFSQRLARQ